jgi:hypothetical protein
MPGVPSVQPFRCYRNESRQATSKAAAVRANRCGCTRGGHGLARGRHRAHAQSTGITACDDF